MLGNTASFESGVALRWEGIGVERDKRIGGFVFLERVVQGDEAGEVIGVGDKSCPD